MIAKCPHCGSILVCWNWINDWSNCKFGDNITWVHECWKCENCFETQDEVKNGIPYELLKFLDKTYIFLQKVLDKIKIV